jgi:hypothetical protein
MSAKRRKQNPWPAIQPPAAFTGKGFEIIGDPTGKCGGKLQYRNGKFRGIQCASPPILTTAEAKRRIPTLAEQVAWFILSRERANSETAANSDDPEHQRKEASARREAHLFAQEITDLMMNGQFLAFSKRVERAVRATLKEQQESDSLRTKEDGYCSALLLVASQCRQPAEVTVSAVADFLRDDSSFCRAYQIDGTMKDQRGVRRGLESIGFGWIPPGRGRGQRKTGKSAK